MIVLGLPPLPLFESYMALESIFSLVFEKADQQLNLRWVTLKNELGLPHQITLTIMTRVPAFAEQELGALALQPNANHNTGLPLTDNQKARAAQKTESDKKRAAAAHDKEQKKMLEGQHKAVAAALQAAKQKDGKGGKGGKGGKPPDKEIRKTPSVSVWAQPCKNWEKGSCLKGINCWYKHQGFPVT